MHGRLRKKGEDLSYANWDYLIMKMVEQMLIDVPNVTFNVDKCWWRIEKIFKWKFYMEHGDDVARYMQTPWYGFERRDGQLTLKLQAKNMSFNYYLLGHHHTPFETSRPDGERICNGTFVGANAFAGKVLATLVHPIQKLFFVHPEMGKVCSYNIRLDPPRSYVK